MKYINYTFLLLFALIASSCAKNDFIKPAHLRIVSAIPNTEAKVIIQSKKHTGVVQSYQLNGGTPTAYEIYSPGYYLISVKANEKIILKRTYVLGKNSYYTLVIAGLMADKPRSVTNSLNYNLMHIFRAVKQESKIITCRYAFYCLTAFSAI